MIAFRNNKLGRPDLLLGVSVEKGAMEDPEEISLSVSFSEIESGREVLDIFITDEYLIEEFFAEVDEVKRRYEALREKK